MMRRRPAGPLFVATAALAVLGMGCDQGNPPPEHLTVAETPTSARTPDGQYISWKEHLIDDEQLSGGVVLRGGDGLQMADLDRDGHFDIVSVHEDNHHIRLAFGSDDPDRWELVTLAEGDEAKAAEDVSITDANGDGLLDLVVACELADINGDGRPDVFTGGYSQNPRDHDGEEITAESCTGRLAWFEQPAHPAERWTRHDVSRRKRGMYDAFIPRDMDGDGDVDFVTTRGNSANFDGVLWLEQVRTPEPAPSFQPARENESAHLPLPRRRAEPSLSPLGSGAVAGSACWARHPGLSSDFRPTANLFRGLGPLPRRFRVNPIFLTPRNLT